MTGVIEWGQKWKPKTPLGLKQPPPRPPPTPQKKKLGLHLTTTSSPKKFKQGDRSDMNNYRPISVISAIAKVFERIVYNQLSSYLSENNILSKYQSGFRSFHSTISALLEATDNWAFNTDRGYVNAHCCLFTSKKGIWHSRSLYSIIQTIFIWSQRNYLRIAFFLLRKSNAKMFCQWCPLTCGIPQGTILGREYWE